jgi:hypothetical protein
MRELPELAFLLAGLLLFSTVVLLLIRAVNAAPWAWLPIVLSPIAAVLVLLPVWRRRRRAPAAGATLLAQAQRPLVNQENAPYMKRYPSPDRDFVAVIASNEVRMSHWIDTISVLAVADGRVVLNLPHPWSSDDIAWGDDNRLRFSARCYPGGAPPVQIDLEPQTQTAQLRGAGEEATVPVAGMLSWLDEFHARHRGAS